MSPRVPPPKMSVAFTYPNRNQAVYEIEMRRTIEQAREILEAVLGDDQRFARDNGGDSFSNSLGTGCKMKVKLENKGHEHRQDKMVTVYNIRIEVSMSLSTEPPQSAHNIATKIIEDVKVLLNV